MRNTNIFKLLANLLIVYSNLVLVRILTRIWDVNNIFIIVLAHIYLENDITSSNLTIYMYIYICIHTIFLMQLVVRCDLIIINFKLV